MLLRGKNAAMLKSTRMMTILHLRMILLVKPLAVVTATVPMVTMMAGEAAEAVEAEEAAEVEEAEDAEEEAAEAVEDVQDVQDEEAGEAGEVSEIRVGVPVANKVMKIIRTSNGADKPIAEEMTTQLLELVGLSFERDSSLIQCLKIRMTRPMKCMILMTEALVREPVTTRRNKPF